LALYTEIAPGTLFRVLQHNLGIKTHDGIYTPRVLLWMMMSERFDARGTLSSSVEQLAQGRLDGLLSHCKRAREHQISAGTGGYSQARQHLPGELVERAAGEVVKQLRDRLCASQGRPIYLMDGSLLRLGCTPELCRTYAEASNQYGKAHWLMVRVVLLQEVRTGLAQHMQWGPACGPKAVSEQGLAQRAIDPVPPGAVMIGDRNFGVFSIAQCAVQRGHDVIVRLTAQRAWKLMGRPIVQTGDDAVSWRPSQLEQRKGHLADGAEVQGRLIAEQVGRGQKKEWVYLFTTLSDPAAEVLRMYGLRWNVETDLRAFKQTLRLQQVSVRTAAMLDKELWAALLAYNLVRTVMCLAAERRGMAARQLSFTRAYEIVRDGYSKVLAASTEAEQIAQFDRLVDFVAQCKLPTRRKFRSYPRAVWHHWQKYPPRKPSKTK